MQPHENRLLDDYHDEYHDELPGEFRVAALVTELYEFVHNDTTGRNIPGVKVGIKDPFWWTTEYVKNYRRYFPRTKFVFGVRHPVAWFQR